MDEGYNNFLNKIKDKLEKNPEYIDEIQSYVSRIEKILDANIVINLVYHEGYEGYKEVMDDESDDFFEKISKPSKPNTISVENFKKFLDDCDDDLKISIDPINLEMGINEISDVIVIPHEDKLLIVPVIENKKEDE